MRLLFLTGAAACSLLALPAAACGGGEADAAGSKAPPMAQYTPAERQAAATTRLERGEAAAKKLYGSDLHQPVPVVTATSAERRIAAQVRWQRASELNKAGLLPVSSDLDYPPQPGR